MAKFSTYPEDTSPTSDDIVLIKDITTSATKRAQLGNLVPSNTITTAKLANGAVTNSKLATTAGELGGSSTTWTPAVENLTVGTGAIWNYANYWQRGKQIDARFKLTLGTSASASNVVKFGFPTATVNYGSIFQVIGRGVFHDSSAAVFYPVDIVWESTTRFAFVVTNASGVLGAWNYVDNVTGQPASGDYFQGYFRVETP